jgi:Protein of unknown function (DUF3515)
VIAVPVALVAGLVAYRMLNASGGSSSAPASPSAGAPSAHSTAPVSMAAPPLSASDTDACALLVSHLPETVRDRARRPVASGSEQNAAYGDPAITLACGARVASVEPTATVYNLSGVCWYPRPGSSATTWTTVDRKVPVTVTVPNSYDAQAQWVVAFSPAIAGALPATATFPSGCSG